MSANILEILSVQYQAFMLILLRVTGLFLVSPVFNRTGIPNTVKIGFSFILSFTLLPTLDISMNILDTKSFVVVAIMEVLVGLLLGFISFLYFNLFYFAGQMIDFKIGFSMVNVFDPQSQIQVPIMGSFYNLLAITIFLTINGDHLLIEAFLNSYDTIQIGTSVFRPELLTQYIDIMGRIFILAFRISAPIIISIFLADLFLGIIAKTIPQINVFIVGMPLKIVVGLAVIAITLPVFGSSLTRIFDILRSEMEQMILILGQG